MMLGNFATENDFSKRDDVKLGPYYPMRRIHVYKLLQTTNTLRVYYMALY